MAIKQTLRITQLRIGEGYILLAQIINTDGMKYSYNPQVPAHSISAPVERGCSNLVLRIATVQRVKRSSRYGWRVKAGRISLPGVEYGERASRVQNTPCKTAGWSHFRDRESIAHCWVGGGSHCYKKLGSGVAGACIHACICVCGDDLVCQCLSL